MQDKEEAGWEDSCVNLCDMNLRACLNGNWDTEVDVYQRNVIYVLWGRVKGQASCFLNRLSDCTDIMAAAAAAAAVNAAVAIASAIAKVAPTHRQCTIEVVNECSDYMLSNPRWAPVFKKKFSSFSDCCMSKCSCCFYKQDVHWEWRLLHPSVALYPIPCVWNCRVRQDSQHSVRICRCFHLRSPP